MKSTVTIPRPPDVVFASLSKDLQKVFSPITVSCFHARSANIESIELLLYPYCSFFFSLASLSLLVAMIGVRVLTIQGLAAE